MLCYCLCAKKDFLSDRLPSMTTNSRYSQHARRALAHARSLAREHAHAVVDSTHLLVGILHEDGSIGCHILQDLPMGLRHTERAFFQSLHSEGTYASTP